MNINCTSDENISKYLSSAQNGYRTYKKIWKKHHKFNNHAKTLVLLFPDDDEVLFNEAISVTPGRLKWFKQKNFCTITTKDYTVDRTSFKNYLGNTVISSEELQDILKAFELFYIHTNCIILSLEYPNGRNASNLMVSGTLTKNNILLDCVLNSPVNADKKAYFKEYIKNMTKIKLRALIINTLLYFSPKFAVNTFYKLQIEPGRKKYKELATNYPDSLLALAPYPGTGDVYLAVSMLNEWQRREGIPKIQTVVIGGANKRICSLYNINAVSLTRLQMHFLSRFCVFAGLENSHTKMLHHDAPRITTGIMDRCRNIKELNFFNIYLYGLYNTTDRSLYQQPTFTNDKDVINKIFEDNNLIPGRTILIAPKNNTLPPIKSSFWKKLVAKLKQMGYTVCTNVASPKEKALKGTVGLFIPYSQIVPFLNEAGHFLSIRSGLCEVITSSNCDKVILYKAGFDWNGKDSIDYFSLKEMGLCSDPTELCYTNQTLDILMQQIIEHYS